MPRKVIHDIIKPIDKSNREGRKWEYTSQSSDDMDDLLADAENESDDSRVFQRRDTAHTPRHNARFRWGVAVAVLLVAIGGFFAYATSAWASAMVRVTLTNQLVTLDDVFTASDSKSEDTVPYKEVTLRRSGQMRIPASHEENVSRKASGVIVVYNTYSTKPQTYVRKTRFQAPDGKIYRTDKRIVIPGMKEDGTPGKVEIEVFADQPGEEYNIGLVDFTIPGLKGSEAFEKVYAKSKTPMTGGFVGVLRSATDEDLENGKSSLRTQLRTELMQELEKTVDTDSYYLFNDGIFVSYSFDTKNDETSQDKVLLSGNAVMTAYLLPKRDLAEAFARKKLSSYDGSPIEVRDFSELIFRFLNKDDFDPATDTTFSFKVTGDAKLVWVLDTRKLREELAGKKGDKATIGSIVQKYPSVREAEVTIKPFWRTSLPADPLKIAIEEKR